MYSIYACVMEAVALRSGAMRRRVSKGGVTVRLNEPSVVVAIFNGWFWTEMRNLMNTSLGPGWGFGSRL